MNFSPQHNKWLPLIAYRHALSFLVLFTLMAAYSIYATQKLTLDADLTALLPDSFKSVQDLERVKERFGGIGYIVLTATGAKPEQLRKFAADISILTTPLEVVSFVDYKRPTEFFKNRGLYFLEPEDLSIINKRIKKRYRWEKQQRNPMYIDLEESAPPSIDFSDLQNKYNEEGNSDWMAAQRADEAYYFNEDKSLIAVFIKPNMTSSDLDFSKKAIADVQQIIGSMDLTQYSQTMKVEMTGRYKKRIDLQQQMQKDLGTASVVSLLLVLAYLFFHFRRAEAIFLILVPLLFGLLFTFAFAAIVFSQLNILTAFIGVILLGLGIDHGIHLLSRYQDERKKGLDESQVITNTFAKTGKAVAVAALTTLVIFAGLGFSEFRAFREFGVIAGAGMIFIMLSYLLCLPPLLKLTARFTWKPSPHVKVEKSFSRLSSLHNKWATRIVLIGIIIVILATLNITNLRFNYNFESLGNSNLRSFQLDRQVNDLLGYSQTPMIALTNDKKEEAFVTETLRNNQIELKEKSGIDFLLSTSDLVPIEQAQKELIIKKIGKIVNKVKPSWLETADLENLEELKKMVAASPFTYADLPIEIRRLLGDQMITSEAQQEGVIMLFPSISLSDGQRIIELAEELRSLQQSQGDRVPVAGESMVLADILNLVFAEYPQVLTLSALFILIVIWLFMRKIVFALMCLVPAIFTICLTLGAMTVLGIELNYLNMLIIPILLGICVDSGVHMVSRAMEGDQLEMIINETGLAIFGSLLTSGLGIGALLLTDHAGLNSLAHVAILGLSINLIVSVLFLPSLLALWPNLIPKQTAVTESDSRII